MRLPRLRSCVIVTPVRHSMPLTWNVASALGMEFERHDRSSSWQRRSSVPKLLKRPPRPYPCTKVAEKRRDRMVPVILHPAHLATASAVRPPDGVALGLRRDDLLLEAGQQQLPFGQGQP